MAGQFNIQFVADTSQSDAKIKQQIQYIQDLERNVRRMGGTFEYAEQEDLEFAKSLGQMQSRATSAKGRVNEMSNAINEMRIFYKRMSEAERQAPLGKAMSQSIQQATQTLRQYRNELNSVSAAQQRMQMSSAASAVSGGISRGALSAVTRGTMYATGMGSGLAMVGGSVAGLGAAAGPAAAAILAVTGLVKATKSAVEVNTEFEQSSANLAAVLGKSRDEIKMLTGDAMRLGSATKYTANEITELQTVLARRGFNETQIKAMTGDITKLATATATDLATSAELVGSTLQSFGLNAIEASRVASVLAVSTTKSALTVDKLATSMSYVSTLAHQFGLSIEDTAALLGVLSNSGLRASQVGTGLRNILNAIANDSSKLSRAMGMPIKNIDDFVKGLKKMKAEGANLGDIGAIIEVRAAPALARFADAADDITRMKEQLQDCVPLMDKMVNEQQNTFAYSMVHLKDEWQGLMLTFSESTGPLRSAADGLSAIIRKLKEIRLFNHGGDQEITLFEKGVDPERAKQIAEKSKVYYDNPHYTSDGHIVSDKHTRKDEDAVTYLGDVLAPKEFKLKQMEAAYSKLQSEDVTTATAWYNYLTGGVTQLWDGGERLKKAGKQMNHDNVREQLAKDIAALRDEIADYNQAIGIIESDIASKKGTGKGAGYRDQFGGKGKSPSENYQERMENALDRYEVSLNKAAMEYENGMLGEKESNEAKAAYTKKREQAEEQLFGAYADVVAEMKRAAADSKTEAKERAKILALIQEYEPNIANESKSVAGLAKEYADLEAEIKAKKDMRALDMRTIDALIGVAKRNGKNMSAEQLGGQSVLDYFGVGGIKEKLKADTELTLDISNDEWLKLVDEINEKLAALKLPKIELDVETGTVTTLTNEVKDMATMWGYVTSAISSVGQALNTIEDPGAKVAGTIAQAVASIAMGFATASAASSKYGVLPWIAATAAGIATMASTIASIKSITAEYHADGGFVGGGPRGTDTVNTWLTPGELVLNRAQQTNLAAQLQPAQMFNPNDFHLETEIRADKFRVMLLQNDRRRGGTGNQYRIK